MEEASVVEQTLSAFPAAAPRSMTLRSEAARRGASLGAGPPVSSVRLRLGAGSGTRADPSGALRGGAIGGSPSPF